MKTLIEKWKPMLEYKFKDGLSVPKNKYQECAEKLETFEVKYKDTPDLLKDVVSLCIKEYSQGKEDFGGGILEFLEEHPEFAK
jgi:uncharacterized protein with ParB-like and HNH nuclease domain